MDILVSKDREGSTIHLVGLNPFVCYMMPKMFSGFFLTLGIKGWIECSTWHPNTHRSTKYASLVNIMGIIADRRPKYAKCGWPLGPGLHKREMCPEIPRKFLWASSLTDT